MKTKYLFPILLSFSFNLLFSQIPQGFNYQAVVRNASGNILPGKTLKLTVAIKTALTGGNVLWEEYHSVTSNYLGLVSFEVGSGIHVSGSVPSFDLIDWKAQPLYLRTMVEYPAGTTTDMGTAQILSVPYSLVAKDVEGPIEKLGIKGKEPSLDSTIFEVKNKDGNTVFAVYNEGVRIYVADGAKGKKGGFAVGSFGTGKAESQKYFMVSKDSIRMYLDSNPATKKPKGGFAVGGYDMAKGTAQDYFLVKPDSTRIYVNNLSGKGKKGGFAVGGFDQAKGPTSLFVDLTPNNYFIGHESGMNIDTGIYNSSIGYQAGKATTGGSANIFIGYQSGYSNTLGSDNTFVGYQAGFNNLGNNYPGVFQHGKWNCYFGYKAGYSSLYGDNNTMIGFEAGLKNQASMNTFIGHQSGHSNTDGMHNTFIGVSAGMQNTLGSGNVFLGNLTGYGNKEGENNIYIGGGAGAYFRSGDNNVVIGDHAGSGTVYAGDGIGSYNVILGFEAGKYAHNGDSNIFIGNHAGYNEPGSNKLIIDNSSSAIPLVYGNFKTNVFTVNGNVDATKFNTVSDAVLKKNITDLTGVTENLKLIRGVYFFWDQSEETGLLLKGGRQVGVIAQDVEKVYPELISVNEKGFKTVDYSKLTPVLLEAIKEQQKQIELTILENHQLRSQLQALQEKIEKIETLLADSSEK